MEPTVFQKGSSWFWEIIDQCGHSKERLRGLLLAFDRERLYRFAWFFIEATDQLEYHAYLPYLDEGTSEDDFEFIAWWVVSQGREHFLEVLQHPERITPHVSEQESSSLYGVAEDLYGERFGAITAMADYYFATDQQPRRQVSKQMRQARAVQ